jgi:hypothetical protein
VFALVKNKLSYGFEDIGLQTMKNIPEPVPAFRLAPSSVTRQMPGAARSLPGWALPAAVAVLAIAVAGAYYWAEHGREQNAASLAAPPVTPAPSPSPRASPAPPPKPFVPALTTQLLKTEPPIGQLPTDASVLVDDGTCPAGQVKQLIGGNVPTGQPRLRSCVPRPADAPPPAAAPPVPVSAPPSPDSAALERMRPYVGNAVEGISNVTGKPFMMTLKAGGTAEVKVELATGGFTVDHGTWWIEPNGHFCVRYVHFAGGNIVCRELTTENGGVKAYTRDHRPNPWVFKK